MQEMKDKRAVSYIENNDQCDRSKSLLVITLNVNVIKRLDELIKTYFNYMLLTRD